MASLQMMRSSHNFTPVKCSIGIIQHGQEARGFQMKMNEQRSHVPDLPHWHFQPQVSAPTSPGALSGEVGRNIERFGTEYLNMSNTQVANILQPLESLLQQCRINQSKILVQQTQTQPHTWPLYPNRTSNEPQFGADCMQPIYVEVPQMTHDTPPNFFNTQENFPIMQTVDRPRYDSISSTESMPSPTSVDDGYISAGSSNHTSDGDGEDPPTNFTGGRVGKRKKKPQGTKKVFRQRDKNSAKLWEWLLYLLNRPERFDNVVRWDNPAEGTFKFGDTDQLTELYNEYKMSVPGKAPKKRIQYESITRALRHCYNTSIINQIPKKKKYRFGENAERWEEGVTRERALESLENWRAGSSN